MPTQPLPPCSMPRCPNRAQYRGRCELHRLTTSQRGYGTSHQAERREALSGASCENCGSTSNLQRDHRVPRSLGGSDASTNKRWLCSSCHARIGLRSTSRGGRVEKFSGRAGSLTLAPKLARPLVPRGSR